MSSKAQKIKYLQGLQKQGSSKGDVPVRQVKKNGKNGFKVVNKR